MKKFFKGLLKAIFAAFIPAVFIVILLFALNQTFAIGLVIILALLFIQFMLSKKSSGTFHWEEYDDLIFGNRNGHYKSCKRLNILFNLTKVVTVLGIFRLIYINYSEILNPFGGLGITIFIALAIISIFTVSFHKHIRSYEAIRGCLAAIVGLTIVSFVYMSFGTQLIWIPLVATLIFGVLFGGFKEIDEVLDDEDVFTILIPILISIIALVSTIIQFWSYIANFFAVIGNFIVKVGTFELISGISVWVVLSVSAIVVIIISAIFYADKKNKAKIEALRIKNEKEAKAKKERMIKENQKTISEAADRTFKEETIKMIEELSLTAKEGPLSKKHIAMLSSAVVKFRYGYLDGFSVKALTEVVFWQFFTVSKIKKQIVWEPDFELVMKMYGVLYARNYEDDDLTLIISRFKQLVNYLDEYNQFHGYQAIKEKICETRIPVTWE